jgi:hypothetical protein
LLAKTAKSIRTILVPAKTSFKTRKKNFFVWKNSLEFRKALFNTELYVFSIQEPIVPTIVSYNASAVKTYNATSSLVRFENQICISALAYWNAGVVGM